MIPNTEAGHTNATKFINKIADAVIAESGRPEDRYHLGKLLLKVFEKHPDHVLQIDGNTGQSDTFNTFHVRTIKAALALRSKGFKHGDVVSFMGPNHLDLSVPLIACQYDGLISAPIDRTWQYREIREYFLRIKPKLVFCQSSRAKDLIKVKTMNGLNYEIITFDDSEGKFQTFQEFLDSEHDDDSLINFKASDFDPEESISVLLCTSATTGPSKSAAVSHKNAVIQSAFFLLCRTKYPKPINLILTLSPMQWVTGTLFNFASCLLVFTRLQTSADITIKHVMEMINDYKPSWTFLSPAIVSMITYDERNVKYDFTSLEVVISGGSALPNKLLVDFKALTKGNTYSGFGLTEASGTLLNYIGQKRASSGKRLPIMDYKIVDVETRAEVGPNVPGELLLKGECVFKGYYGCPEATKEAFTDDGYFKTGDIFCKDEEDYFYFVDRLKLMLKYFSHQISPIEIENVIKAHTAVSDAGVSSVYNARCGDLVVACVVPKSPGCVTEDEIKDWVKETLAPAKQLRGGVLFVKSIPVTATYKVNRKALKALVVQRVDPSKVMIEL